MTYSLGLIGYPIKHSLSPWIHEQFLSQLNLDGSYELFEIDPSQDFKAALSKLKELNLTGFNVTVPYKETIIDYLDEIDEQALKIGAVNTVLNNNGRWIGYNTDGLGYVDALEDKYPSIIQQKASKILILGSGGASRGIYNGLKSSGYHRIDIANRTAKKADEISKTNLVGQTKIISLTKASEELAKYDIIIQTTSVGMKPNEHEKIIDLKQLSKDSIVSDIVYQPIMTKFLYESKEIGANIHHGHTMLLYQAKLAFEIWTGKQVELNNMEQKLQGILEG